MITVEERIPKRPDRRRRYGHNPAKAITVNIDIDTLERLDDYVIATRGSRSGVIRLAMIEYLERHNEDGA